MNRFEYTNPDLLPNELFNTNEKNVRLYDGNNKTKCDCGELTVTTHRIFWGIPGAFSAGEICLALPIRLIHEVEEVFNKTFDFSRSRRIILHLLEPDSDRNEGVQTTSDYNFIKVSFRDGLTSDMCSVIRECVRGRRWLMPVAPPTRPNIKLRSGIMGIERSLEEKNRATDQSISNAFQDLSKLMSMAKNMVSLSKNISTKIRDKQGDISEDETVRFKMYLMSLGIDDPVTRDDHKSKNDYYCSLARQICNVLVLTITDIGGIMTLSDVYCRVNRSRGLELLSPEDLLHACSIMEDLDLPLRMHRFQSGVKVLQTNDLDGDSIIDSTMSVIKANGSVTSMELSQELSISVILAKERLLATENIGRTCRDESISGLRFYPNLFCNDE